MAVVAVAFARGCVYMWVGGGYIMADFLDVFDKLNENINDMKITESFFSVSGTPNVNNFDGFRASDHKSIDIAPNLNIAVSFFRQYGSMLKQNVVSCVKFGANNSQNIIYFICLRVARGILGEIRVDSVVRDVCAIVCDSSVYSIKRLTFKTYVVRVDYDRLIEQLYETYSRYRVNDTDIMERRAISTTHTESEMDICSAILSDISDVQSMLADIQTM